MVEGRFPLEVQDGVHDVLEGARPGDAAALGHMTDQKDRGPRFLGEPHQARRAFAHLADVAWGTFELVRIGRLNRIDEHHARAQGTRMVQDSFELGLAQHVHRTRRLSQPIRSQLHL